jgi:tape measure domain-containing protein
VAVDVLDTILRLSGVGSYLTGFRQVSAGVSSATDKQVQFHQTGVAAFAGMGAAAVTIASGLRTATREAGAFEAKVTAFSRLFGSREMGEEMLQELREFSGKSNFSFGGAVQFAQRLRAMGFEARDLTTIMGTLGDAVAATGGSHDELDRVVLAFGQIRTRGKLAQQEINQLSQANIPAMEILQQRLGLTDEELKDIGRHGISSAAAIEALLGGLQQMYGGQMKAFLESAPGRIHQMKNQWEMFRLEVGKPLVPATKGIAGGAGVALGFGASHPMIGAGVSGLGVMAAGAAGAMSLNAFARMSGMAVSAMQKSAGMEVSPTAGALTRTGLGGALGSLLSSNPAEFAKVSEENAKRRQAWMNSIAEQKFLDKAAVEYWRKDTAQIRAENSVLKKSYQETLREFNKDRRDYEKRVSRARSTGELAPRMPARLLREPVEPVYRPLPDRPTATPPPAFPGMAKYPGLNRGAIARGAGLGLLGLGGAIGGGMLLSHAETQKDSGTRFWEAFAGGALTGGSTGAMMGLSFGGAGGALGGGIVGALLGGLASAYGIGEYQSGGQSKMEQLSEEQIKRMEAIHDAIVAGSEGGQMSSRILSGGDEIRRPFPESDFAKAMGESF